MATIENYATVSYTSGGVDSTKTSNLAEIELNSSLRFSKTTLGSTYTAGVPITFILSITNCAASTVCDVKVTDDLGTTTCDTTEITPLTFVAPALLLLNGRDCTSQLDVDSCSPEKLTFKISSIAPGTTANIIYKAVPNEYAPLEACSCITNKATLSSCSDCASGCASATVCVEEAADIEVVKSMCPNPVMCGDTVTYTIRIYNYGNICAENVRLTDTFTPAPENITVYRDGTALDTCDYTYADGTLTIPAKCENSESISPATFNRDECTCKVTVAPSIVEYVIIGTI